MVQKRLRGKGDRKARVFKSVKTKEEAAELIINGHSRTIAFSISAAIAAGALVFAAGKWSGGMDRDLLEVQRSIDKIEVQLKEINVSLSTNSNWRAETTAALASQLSIIQTIQKQQERNSLAIEELSSGQVSQKKSVTRILQ